MVGELMKEGIEFTILMPCLNEARTVGICIGKAREFLQANEINGEILVCDNGSTDESVSIANRLADRVIHVKEKGYGSALNGGINAAKGKYVIMGDSDESYDFGDLALFVDKLRGGYDLVIGNRFMGGIMSGAMPLLHKYFGNPILSFIGRLFFACPCRDFHCGLRGGRVEALRDLELKTRGMEFASEMIVKSCLRGLKIAEVPVILYRDGRQRPAHLRSWRDGWRHLRFLLMYSPNWLFLIPGILLTIFGLFIGILLVPGTKYVFDINTLLYAATFIIIGFNAVLFALFTKVFAANEGLLAGDKMTNRFQKIFKLERGLLLGLVMLCMGVGGSLYSLFIWKDVMFGALEPVQIQRIIIPSVTLIIIGFQIIVASFFLSILQIDRK